MVEAKAVHDGGLKVVDMHLVLDNAQAEFIGLADYLSPFMPPPATHIE